MKTNLKILVIAVLSFVTYSCNKDIETSVVEACLVSDALEMIAPPPPSENSNSQSVNGLSPQPIIDKKKIIKDGRIKIEVEKINESKSKLDLTVKKLNGYISNESFNDDYGTSEYVIKIRVPSEKFDLLIANIENGNKNIVSKSISARDVTEEFIDLETRLKNKKNYLQRYNDLLLKAKTVDDILKIEGNTRVIEEEIESTEGRLKYLNDQVSYSTLDVTLFLKSEYIEKPLFKGNFFSRIVEACKSGFYGIVEFIIYIFRIWPVWLITIITFVVIRKIIKKRRNKK